MFKAKAARVAAFALAVAGAAVFISCQSNGTSPVTAPSSDGERMPNGFDAVGVQGTIEDTGETPVSGANVVVRCMDPCDAVKIDDDDSDALGFYECDASVWGDHDGHSLRIHATKVGYTQVPFYAWITDFDPSSIPYTRGLVMEAGR